MSSTHSEAIAEPVEANSGVMVSLGGAIAHSDAKSTETGVLEPKVAKLRDLTVKLDSEPILSIMGAKEAKRVVLAHGEATKVEISLRGRRATKYLERRVARGAGQNLKEKSDTRNNAEFVFNAWDYIGDDGEPLRLF